MSDPMRLLRCAAPAFGVLLIASGAHAQGGAASSAGGQNGPASHAGAIAAQAQPGGSMLSAADRHFLDNTASGADYELELAKLAGQKATRQTIKQHAQAIVSDHEQLNTALHDLAAKKGLQLPAAMTDQQRGKLNRLRGMNGNPFDQAYGTEMRRINQDDKQELQKEVSTTRDPDVKGFAQQMQAADAKHEQMIRAGG